MADDSKTSKAGWTDRELLCSLLYLINKQGVTLNWNEGRYPPGRNASGFKQKINILKRNLKAEWDGMPTGGAVPDGTPKKPSATPRKRKNKSDEDDEKPKTPKKARGRAKAEAVTPDVQDRDGEKPKVKVEPREEQSE